jgi:hypothetical protein
MLKIAVFAPMPMASIAMAMAEKLNVEKLVKSGILREATGNRRNRIYVAPEILQIISSRETTPPPASEAPHASEP